jgi:hypothetical protein
MVSGNVRIWGIDIDGNSNGDGGEKRNSYLPLTYSSPLPALLFPPALLLPPVLLLPLLLPPPLLL